MLHTQTFRRLPHLCARRSLFQKPATRGVKTIALVLDNGTTHAAKQLPQWVKELATKSDRKLTMQLYWLPRHLPHGSIKLRSGSAWYKGNSSSRTILPAAMSLNRPSWISLLAIIRLLNH